MTTSQQALVENSQWEYTLVDTVISAYRDSGKGLSTFRCN